MTLDIKTAEEYLSDLKSNNSSKSEFTIKNNEIFIDPDRTFIFKKNVPLSPTHFQHIIHAARFTFTNNIINNEIFNFLRLRKHQTQFGETIQKDYKVDGIIEFNIISLDGIKVPFKSGMIIETCDSSDNLMILKSAKDIAYIYNTKFESLENVSNGVKALEVASTTHLWAIKKLPSKLELLTFYIVKECPSDILRVFLYDGQIDFENRLNHLAIQLVNEMKKENFEIYDAAAKLIEKGYDKYANV